MIIKISRANFEQIVQEDFLDLPTRWDGRHFRSTLNKLYNDYLNLLSSFISEQDLNQIIEICTLILQCVGEYHRGFPHKAFAKIEKAMEKLMVDPLNIHGENGVMETVDLYRVRNTQQNINYERKNIFHTPYSLRSKVPTCRYSISGYPCLYLATSINLCREESKRKTLSDLTIASKYKFLGSMLNNGIVIDVLELGIKPKDFLDIEQASEKGKVFLGADHMDDIEIMGKYLYWYPLIAACSFIRANKNDPFASEYIVPQLLMQWIRSQIKNNKLLGIRYFSCASIKASKLGHNYVFPVSGERYSERLDYCKVLANAFALTKPCYIHEFNSIAECENFLNSQHLARISD